MSAETKYILEDHELSQFEVSRSYEDMRGASEYDADHWVDESEPLFTVPEIRLLFE